MLPVLNIGSLAIQTPGLVLLAGLWLGLWLAEKKYPRFAVQPAVVNNLVFAGLVSLVVGGRLAFIAENLSSFIKSPASVISLKSLFTGPAGRGHDRAGRQRLVWRSPSCSILEPAGCPYPGTGGDDDRLGPGQPGLRECVW